MNILKIYHNYTINNFTISTFYSVKKYYCRILIRNTEGLFYCFITFKSSSAVSHIPLPKGRGVTNLNFLCRVERLPATQFQICRAEKLSPSGRVARKRRERSLNCTTESFNSTIFRHKKSRRYLHTADSIFIMI